MGFIEDIDNGLRKLEDLIDREDPAYIRVDCPRCNAQDIKVHKMRARHGHVQCPECGTELVIMMRRD